MSLPNESVSLDLAQVAELNKKLATLRHDVNNDLSLIIAAAEIIRRQPQSIDRMWSGLEDRPKKIAEALAQFSREFEKVMNIPRP